MCVLALQAVEHRAAVPGSLGRQIGILPASAVVNSIVWGGPAVLALILGWLSRTSDEEHGTPRRRPRRCLPWGGRNPGGRCGTSGCALVMS